MEKLQPAIRWIAIAGAVGALAFAIISSHRSEAPVVSDAATPPPALAATGEPSPATSAAPSDLAVYVCGAVRKAGVYHLPTGSRVIDAVNRAGGLGADADPEAINLASPLTDGMKVDVLKKGARAFSAGVEVGYSQADPGTSTRHHRSSGRSSSHKLSPGQTLDINTASESELVALPGVGPSLARRIVEYRQANGPFATLDDLQNVSGIGPSKFAKMEPFLTL